MAKVDELHSYAYPSSYLDELHRYDKEHAQNDVHIYGNRGATYGLDEVHLYGGYYTTEDETNTPSERKPIDIDEYFDEIEDLDEEQKEQRKELAKDFKDILMLILALLLADLRLGNEINVGFYQNTLKSRLMDAVEGKLPTITSTVHRQIEQYIDTNVRQVIESTVRNQEDAYFFSETRATSIAVDDAMASLNLEELDEAIKAGYKFKKWVTMHDSKVRHTHREVDDKVVDIRKSFNVGRCKMTAPMVFSEDSPHEDAKEIINCRCFLVFSNNNKE